MPAPENKRRFFRPHKEGCACPTCKQKHSCNGSKEAQFEPTGDGREIMGPISAIKGPFKEIPLDEEAREILTKITPTTVHGVITDNKTPRAYIAQWQIHRTEGLRNDVIADKLGISESYLKHLIRKATKDGWLTFDDPEERLEHEIKPIIVDNVKHFLVQKDRTMTIEAAKGTGLFKSHQAVRMETNQPQTVLALKIEAVDTPIQIVEGNIVGRPRELKE